VDEKNILYNKIKIVKTNTQPCIPDDDKDDKNDKNDKDDKDK
jgi:hypothetical protein